MSSKIKNRIKDRYDNQFSGIMDNLAVIATGYYANQEKADKEQRDEERRDTLVDRNFRIKEIDRLRLLDPMVDHYDFGNVIYSPEDFKAYKDEVMFRVDARNKGGKYIPVGGSLSEEAEGTLYTYGGQSIDYSPAVSFEEMNQYEAWLLGKNATGNALNIASDHNWEGLLSIVRNEESAYNGYAVLDEEEYRDLYDKGLVENVDQFPDGFYKLDQNQIDNISRQWGYWKEGFISTYQPTTGGDMSLLIQGQNTKIREMDAELAKDENWKNKYSSILKWDEINTTAFSANTEMGGILEDKNTPGDYKFKYSELKEVQAADGTVKLEPQPHIIKEMLLDEFQETFPHVYELYNSGIQEFSSAYTYFINNKEELGMELAQLPDVERNFYQTITNFEAIQQQRQSEGINLSQVHFIENSLVQGEGRDTVLGDIQNLDNILLDEVALSQLTTDQHYALIDKLAELEREYLENNNQPALEFLKIYNSDVESIGSGRAVSLVLAELRGTR